MTVTFEEFSPTHDFFDYKGPNVPDELLIRRKSTIAPTTIGRGYSKGSN